MLIVLAATVVLAASWMFVLRPKAVESTTTQVAAPAKIADKAREAAAATDAKSAATEAGSAKVDEADPAAPAQPAPAAKAAKPKAPVAKAATPAPATSAKAGTQAKPADGQRAVLADIDAHKVVVLLFWARSGADDRAAHAAVEGLDTHGGKVAVHVIDVKDVGRYESVTQGVDVTQSPTTIVISRDAKARSVAGLTDPTEVQQLVREALSAK